jgi:phosphoribosylformylglycinamidine synthase PurS subunit
MSHFRIAVHITPRRGILDPQGKTVTGALHTLGFGSVTDVHVGRYIIVEIDAADQSDAERQTREMCEKLLANPVIEDFEIAGADRHADAATASRSAPHPDASAASGGPALSPGRQL